MRKTKLGCIVEFEERLVAVGQLGVSHNVFTKRMLVTSNTGGTGEGPTYLTRLSPNSSLLSNIFRLRLFLAGVIGIAAEPWGEL